jgi:preprotein translocase subunit SecD
MTRILAALLLTLMPFASACGVVDSGPVVTVEYSFDLEQAELDGLITAQERADEDVLLEQTMEVLRARLDPQGNLDLDMRVVGDCIAVDIAQGKMHNVPMAQVAQGLAEEREGLALHMRATNADLMPYTDVAKELERAREWRTANPGVAFAKYNALTATDGGPWRGADGSSALIAVSGGQPVVLLEEADPRFRFSAMDINGFVPSADSQGNQNVLFELVDSRKGAFEAWTGAHVDHSLAIVLDGEVLSMATILSRLPGAGVVNGGDLGGGTGRTAEEVADLVSRLRGGTLPIPLKLVR